MAKLLVLLKQPGALEIPPLDAVEEIIEPGAGKGENGLFGGAEILGTKYYLGISPLGVADQTAPDLGGYLVGGIAADPAKPQSHVMAHQLLKIGEDLALLWGAVVELGEIAPHGLPARVGGVGGV